jgi:hypothetical protein
LPIRVKERCEDYEFTKSINSDDLEESDASLRTDRAELNISLTENKMCQSACHLKGRTRSESE